ncbi:hypothetical protein LLG46_14135 [bacterium]|nr:hypothetical protein [bacterium]
MLKVSASGFHKWRNRPKSSRDAENNRLAEKIKEVFKASGESYGSRRMCIS